MNINENGIIKTSDSLWPVVAMLAMLVLALQVYVLTKHSTSQQTDQPIGFKSYTVDYQYVKDGKYHYASAKHFISGKLDDAEKLKIAAGLFDWYGADKGSPDGIQFTEDASTK